MEILYRSTRNAQETATASEAILKGLADDGGLFVPDEIPALDISFEELADMDYKGVAFEVMSRMFTDFTEDELRFCIDGAYDSKFDTELIAPVKYHHGAYILELFHGKTIAFKDMALSILPYLMTTAAKKNKSDKEIVILTATSGDTGKAALAGFADVPGTRIAVFYPKNGVSPVQEKQMVTEKGKNTFVAGIKGNFDDAQTGVKKMFSDKKLAVELADKGFQFSSANSINIGRLVPQMVYYVYSYTRLLKAGMISAGDKINIVVPTGNFGNILAAYYAKKMGVPINKLICASNANNVLTDFLRTGTYNRNRKFHTTVSPSMDILISSNLERMLFELYNNDDKTVAALQSELSSTGKFSVSDQVFDKMKEIFWGGCCTDEQTLKTIGKLFEEKHYLCDTHTAVAVNVYEQYKAETKDERPAVIASTASPYKFAASVLSAITDKKAKDEFDNIRLLSELTDTCIPKPIQALENAEVRFRDLIEKDDMLSAVYKALSIN